MEYDCDVAVAGGGISGAITAISAAYHSKQNLKIKVFDINSFSEMGKKTTLGWSCGDATSTRSIDFLNDRLKLNFGYPAIEHQVKGVKVISPDYQTELFFEGSGKLLNRKQFPQALFNHAKKLGVDFVFNSSVSKLLLENGRVVGIEGRNPKNNRIFKERAKVVVDATGMGSPLRRQIPDGYVEKELSQEDVVAIERYILYFNPGDLPKTNYDKDFALIQFNQYISMGGYQWTFGKGERYLHDPAAGYKVNVGIGLSNLLLAKRNQRFGRKDTLHSLNVGYIKDNIGVSIDEAEKNMFSQRLPRLADGEEDSGNEKNSWSASVRRQNDCLVSNGIVLVGDSAWFPRPIDAGGIGNSFYGGVFAGEVIAE